LLSMRAGSRELLRLSGDIAEIALHAGDGRQWRTRLLERLARSLGVDAAAVGGVHPDLGCQIVDLAGHAPLLVTRLHEFFREVHQAELETCLIPRVHVDDDVFDSRRRDILSIYREYLRPLGIASYALRMWPDDTSFHWIAVALPSGARRRPFIARAEATFAALFPVIALGERLHVFTMQAAEGTQLAWLDGAGVSQAEQRVLRLVGRGLTNREVAVALGLSPNTVRNTLARAFQKLDVSSRAELAYVLASVGSTPGTRRTVAGSSHCLDLAAQAAAFRRIWRVLSVPPEHGTLTLRRSS
jgi:DNA-binding CsgD family transcriptional regulator